MAVAGYAREALIERASEAESVKELFLETSARLRRLLEHDGAVWLAADPATGMPTAPSLVETLGGWGGRGTCIGFWEAEFGVDDVIPYAQLARAERPADGLRLATGDEPTRSHRYRFLLEPNGIGDELRAVLRVDGRPWGLLSLFREAGRPAFDGGDSTFVASLSEPLADAVRDLTRPRAPLKHGAAQPGPGLMIFDHAGRLSSLNDAAEAWLDELNGDHWEPDEEGVPLPMVVLTTLMRARGQGHARARTRGCSGGWLVCHASCLRTPGGELGETALVIESAQPSEVAPIIAEAYELSAREREITELIARGCGTAEIATRLILSRHTVRDYVKTIFAKVGVSSRGELVAHLFNEHYAPIHTDPANIIRT
jgi:DNA-binding CsgD family transcriptional regulator